MARRELSWIKQFAQPNLEKYIFRDSEQQQNPSAHIDLLERYLKLIPYLSSLVDFKDPVMLHMDLHFGNIFIQSANEPKITSIIDWQGTVIHLLYFAARFPRIVDFDAMNLEVPSLPSDFDTLDQEKQQSILETRNKMILKEG